MLSWFGSSGRGFPSKPSSVWMKLSQFAKQMKKSLGPWPRGAGGKLKEGWYFRTSPEYRFLNYNPRLRAPLFQLVFHDSVVGTWRWDAPANRFLDRETWDVEDLFNLLYATSPMFTLDTKLWPDARERILKTIHSVCDFALKVAGVPMIDHRYLTPDRLVQQATFANGWATVVNFSRAPYLHPRGFEVKPMSARTFRRGNVVP